MSQPKCPFCLSIHDFSNLSEPCFCAQHPNEPDFEVPVKYISEYNRVPPLWLMTVGFRSHGKTCYLAALTMILENLGKAIPGATVSYLDLYTRKSIQDIRHQAMVSYELPDHTPSGPPPRPMLIQAYDLPEVGSNTLVLYDTPGEMFESVQIPQEREYLQHLNQVKNIWFLISLKDLAEMPDKRIDDLLNFYLNGMQRLRVPVANRNLIVVYTKADEIVSTPTFNLPISIVDYLQKDDPFQTLTNLNIQASPVLDFSFSRYVAKMQETSDALQDFTRQNVPGGANFIDLVKKNNLGLYFSIVSALGTSGRDKRLQVEAVRYRVIDPYFWALYLNRPESNRAIRLVLDASSQSPSIYSRQIREFAEDLCSLGEVTSYYLGQTHSASRANQAPPGAPPKSNRPRLIGPILSQTDPNTSVIVITAGAVHDLDDYARTWGERLFLVSVGEEEYQNWPNSVVLREGDPLDVVLTEFRRFLAEKQIS